MNKSRSLYKAFGSNLEMPKPNGEKKVKIYNRFGMIAFWGIMVPISVLIGYITYVLTDLLFAFDGNAYGLLSELDIISAFAMIFGMPLMFSVLYFSSDLGFLTALPITPVALYKARFWHTFKAENVMTSNVLFAIYVGYFIAAIKRTGYANALHPVAIISAVVGLFGSILLPLIYCSILAMLLMLILRKFNRADIYYYSSLVLFVGFTLMFLLSFRSYGQISVVNYLDSLVLSNNEFTSICNVLFPTNYLTTLTLRRHTILPLVGAVAILAGLYFLSVLIAHLTYRKGLFAAAVISNKKASGKTKSGKNIHSISSSLLLKEFRVLTRNMTYRMNCVYANLLWPIAAVIFVTQAHKLEFFKVFTYKLGEGDAFSHVILFSIVIASSFIASGLNSIASTSFTREGVHLDMLKYLPVSLDKQIKSKALIALLFTFIPLAIAIAIATIGLGAYYMLPLYAVVSFISVLIATMIGMLMDSISPYLVWSDELSALRGNLNCFFNLAAQMVAALAIGAASFGIYKLFNNSIVTLISITIVLIVSGLVASIVGMPKMRENIESLK